MSSQSRNELIQNAVLFLNDPKVQSSPLAQRITFLETKGLNEDEIQRALGLAANGGSEAGPSRRDVGGDYGYGYGYGQAQMGRAPQPPGRDWRDLFIMAVVSGGVMYGLTALARKYLLPHLQPPSTTAFQQTSQSLTDQYDEAARLLNELSTQTTTLQQSLETDRERVKTVVEEVEDAVRSVKEGEAAFRDEMREVRGEVESVRELVPKMIEKHAASQSAALQDLQSELRSLKTLLQSRQAAGGATKENGSSTTSAANALLAPRGKGIPAWQLPSNETNGKSDTTGPSEAASESG